MFKDYGVCILSVVTGHHLFYEYTYIGRSVYIWTQALFFIILAAAQNILK